MSNLKKVLIGLTLACLALFFGWLAIAGNKKQIDRSEILQRAREAKLAKSLTKNESDSIVNDEKDES